MAWKSSAGTAARRARKDLAERLRSGSRGRALVNGLNRLVDVEKRLSGGARILPDIFVIGSQKAGTTTVWARLVAHPDVYRNDPKEPHFFDDRYAEGLDWYRGHYPLTVVAEAHQKRTGQRLRGLDASPSYIINPHAPRRVAEAVPDARLLALVREPVARAYSHYQHNRRRGTEVLDFADAIAAEPGRIDGETDRMLADETYYSRDRGEFSYALRGRYAEHLDRWLEHFAREQLLILTLDELERDPDRTHERILDHCGLTPRPLASEHAANTGGYADPLPEEVRAVLADHFEPHNRRLAELMGRPLPW